MIDLGTVKPGSTIRIPFSSFDKDDGSSITMTNYAAGDILVYKDGSTTERASTSGFTATTDFDAKTGKHLAIIDLADNTTAGFFGSGSEYLIAIDAVTVDAVTTGGWIARFKIGYPDAHLDTTIATLASQTSFTLTAGPAEDDALNGCVVLIHDIASAVQFGYAVVSDYTGSTKTVTLTAGVTFTAAASDNISFFAPGNARWFAALLASALPLAPTTAGRTLDVTATGAAGIDWANIENPTTTVGLSGTTVKTATDVETDTADIQSRLPAALVSGRIDASVGAMAANVMTAAAAASDLTTEIQSGLATAASLATAQADLDILTGADGAIIASGTQTFNMTGNLSGSVGSVTGNVGGNVVGSIGSLAAQAKADVNAEVDSALDTAIPGTPTANSINERIQTLDNAYTGTRAGYLDNVNNAGLATTVAQTGDSFALANGANGFVAIKGDTAAILLDTGTDGVIVATNNDKTNYRLSATGVSDIGTAILTTALTESYAADGAAPTLAQAIFAIQQMMQERSISSTTMTIKKLDGSTTAMTLTLNDSVNPTAITRST